MPMAQRGSIGFAVMRLLTSRTDTTCFAAAKAASAAALSPNAIVTPILPSGQSGQILGACGFIAEFEIDDRGQRLVVHGDKLGGVARLCFGLGDDKRNTVADAANPVGEKNRTGGWIPFGPTP